MARHESRELQRTEPGRMISPFWDIERRMEDLFRRPFSMFPRLMREELEVTAPSIDVFEQDNNVVVKADLPGMKKEDLDINLSPDMITISGEKKQEEKTQEKDYYIHERSYGSFSRSIMLPADVQTDQAKAEFHDGILEVKIPKSEEAQKKQRKLQIQ